MKRFVSVTLVFLTLFILSGCSDAAESTGGKEVVPGIPVKNTVTMVDLGAKTCVPCKLMAPILAELQVEYQGRAEVIFIDVWDKANEGKAQKFKIMAIPTQIFYDRQGKETFRHTGFFDKKSIAAKLDELLGR